MRVGEDGMRTEIIVCEGSSEKAYVSSAMTFFQGKRNETFPERFTIVS